MSPDKIMKPIARFSENKIYWQQQFTLREKLAFSSGQFRNFFVDIPALMIACDFL
jgi:hypothetical protein